MNANSRQVASTQTAIHPRLADRLARHFSSAFQRPVAAHNQAAFERCRHWISDRERPLVLDSGCGVGESTSLLAEQFPDALIIGVDKSAARLAKYRHGIPQNAFLVRADLSDFWRLAAAAGWRLQRHYLLYPNPWPKPEHLQRRWHGSPVLPFIIALGGQLELRSNWRLYVEEFVFALAQLGFHAVCEAYQAAEAWTPFERKYWSSGQRSWRCLAHLQDTESICLKPP